MRRTPSIVSRCILVAAAFAGLPPAAFCAPPEREASSASGPSGAVIPARLEQVGFDGYYKLGRWTPAVVRLDASSDTAVQIVARARDPDGSPTAVPHPVRLEAVGGAQPLTVLFRNGRLGADPAFELVELDANGAAVRTSPLVLVEGALLRPALRQSAFLVAQIGRRPGSGNTTASENPPSEPQSLPAASDDLLFVGPPDGTDGGGESIPLYAARLAGGDRLPSDPRAFDSLDALVITGQYDLDESRSDAVRAWVRLGGHLVVSVGSDVGAYLDSTLGRWISGAAADAPVPLSDRSPMSLRELSGLEGYSAQRIPIEIPRSEGIPVAAVGNTAGSVLVRARGDLPLIVRVPYGFGRITFVAVDLDRPPLSEWTPAAAVMRKLLGIDAGQIATASGRSGRLAQSGITDLASQLASVRREFPQVDRASLWTVMGLLVGYLVLIGPLDYLLVHRLLRKPHLTWVTLPLFVALTAGLAGWTARRTNGDQVRANRLDLIDIEGQFQSVRARSWLTLYSPGTQRFALAAEPARLAGGEGAPAGDASPGSTLALRPDTLLSWSGTPESIFGGMYRSGGLDIGRPAYRFGPHSRSVENLPLAIWATKDLEAQWHNQARTLVEADLSLTPAGQLRGRLTHHLPQPIEDWVVAVGRRVYLPSQRGEPVSLRPGMAWPADANWEAVGQRDLSAWLTGVAVTRVIRQDNRMKENAEYRPSQRRYDPFDPSRIDPAAEILRMITFHRAAGGKTYTGLDNHGFRAEELSETLDLGRAVLFGRIDLPATEFQVDGKPIDEDATRRAAFVRIVLPVAPGTR